MAVNSRDAVFALLDDCGATAALPSSRLYTGFVRERVCTGAAQLEAVCDGVAADTRNGVHAVVLADYEFGRSLVGIDQLRPTETQRGNATLRFLLFEHCTKLAREEVDAWLMARDNGALEPSVAGTANVRESVDRAQFEAAIDAIHAALCAGDSYQVNYTYRLGFDVFGSPLAFYRRLRARQPVPFGALIGLPDDAWVLSCSPELFVEKHGATLRARPMKGTAPRSDDPVTDQGNARFLANDPKNRAENVMIVDLLRNDLSRVARIGSVNVPALFSVEPYASVWQMTSTVEATLLGGTSFATILRALFPCGSITGAPKHRTMQLIDELESTPRGLYTGAIGWLDAPGDDHDCGDFCLSVAIRTLTLTASAQSGGMDCLRGSMGIGAGIVLDSVAAEEHEECRLKGRFLTGAEPGFDLFETMYVTREDGVRHLERHLLRLSSSATTLGFGCDEGRIREEIAAQCARLPAQTPHRMRLALSKSGATQITAAVLAPLADAIVGVLLGSDAQFAPTHAADPLLRHKTTRRADYDRGWREAEAKGAFDTLFFNERGELTEGGRSNVFVKLAGRWWTPPLASGLLPGVMRSVLLDEASGLQAAEKVLTQADVLNADALLVCNALRGAVPARLVR
ncbi:aminodeoxychorismate synthase component I [Paraburkholderia sp. MMS20-SJTN17]|uniref:Aminodeoxychorismate synthase component I n=1 Tax=Paraburkholderia translucens TaxID=2886945 RepID=A0ABS8K9C0_9BURK|nr:aminodeoxychorismate synthase component I [Paraburkholderia sp. MMS20-SJTN17]MCC8401338.1 aminodeoxychorismate synthase component I [Paraburkholderia sp. MMS20-SJTN17]